MTNLGQKGFTLIEVIIVIAVISIMLATAGYYMGDQGKKAHLKSAARDLISNMNLARTRAIRDTRPWAIKFNTPALNSYTVYSDSGEPFAPTDPANQVKWDDGDEITFRTVTLPQNVSFGSNLTQIDGTTPVGDGVTYTNDLIVFNPNGTSSEAGAVYFSVLNDPSMASKSLAVSTLKATGRVKSHTGNGSSWTH